MDTLTEDAIVAADLGTLQGSLRDAGCISRNDCITVTRQLCLRRVRHRAEAWPPQC